ncbi:OmpA family protein [Pedobacter gandavensis]|uniref:OmpA family protein n=1 Tax=Pedobacter gandavensis TaxID=2679963 RepID=A0ABR6EWF5_9SPHI|nr:OmpA family protein [Pedobacter gandavensis]MBB2149311.1 OmpA family protein [Pedobacter gandavensis]
MNRTAFKSPDRSITRLLIIGILALFLGNYGMAQEQLSRKQQADVFFNRYEYYPASRLYLPLAERKNPDLKVLEQLAACYRMMNEYDEAEKWYSKVVLNPKASPLSYYYYAEALQRNEKFDLAKSAYMKYAEFDGHPKELALKIASCDSAALWIKTPRPVKIKNMESLNTKSADWGLTAYGNDGLAFTSERPLARETKGKDLSKWNGNPWLKLFSATADGQLKGELAIVTEANRPAKAEYHVGPVVFNSTGDIAYVTIATRAPAAVIPLDKTKGADRLYTRRLELLIARENGDKWDLKSFPYNDVKAYSLGHAAVAQDGKLIYFASDMPGGFGKSDIWFSQQQADGSWGKPVNCGAEINTGEEDTFPTIGPNGELFFASKGKIGMGGYDLYVSKGSGTQWSKSENLKYPLNSTSDDFYLFTKDGKFGYLSSNRQGGAGDDDIYSFSDEQPPMMILALSGSVFDKQSKARLGDVSVILTDGDGKQLNTKLTAQDGNFFFGLAKDQDYKVSFGKLGYAEELKTISTKGLTKSDTLTMQAFLNKEKFEPGKTYVLKNIYYDFDKSNIRPDAAKELDKLLAILKENPAITIELGSHTDSRGSDQYNQWLSQRRANAAAKYLTDRGIDHSRISAKGYGETMLLNQCGNGVKCSHAEHQLNRRTEFKIIKN